MTVGWLLSPSGWPVHADSDDEHAELTARGYDPITEDQVAPAVAAFQAAEASPPSTQLPGYALAVDVAAALATKADASALATKANASSLALKQDKATLGADAAAAPELRAALVLPKVGSYTYNTDGTVASGPDGETYAYNTDGTVHSVTLNGVTRVYSYNTDGTIAGAA